MELLLPRAVHYYEFAHSTFCHCF